MNKKSWIITGVGILVVLLAIGGYAYHRHALESVLKNAIQENLQAISDLQQMIDASDNNKHKEELLKHQAEAYNKTRNLVNEAKKKDITLPPELPLSQDLANDEAEIRQELADLYIDKGDIEQAQEQYQIIITDEEVSPELQKGAAENLARIQPTITPTTTPNLPKGSIGDQNTSQDKGSPRNSNDPVGRQPDINGNSGANEPGIGSIPTPDLSTAVVSPTLTPTPAPPTATRPPSPAPPTATRPPSPAPPTATRPQPIVRTATHTQVPVPVATNTQPPLPTLVPATATPIPPTQAAYPVPAQPTSAPYPEPIPEEPAPIQEEPPDPTGPSPVAPEEPEPIQEEPPDPTGPSPVAPEEPEPIQEEPPTAVPPTAVPPTAVPPTAVPPTAVPPTAVPPTAVPPTAAPYPDP